MHDELDRLDDLGSEMTRRARAAGVRLIWRAQARTTRSVLVRDGRTENSSASSFSGHGAQVVTDDGATALASRDDFRRDPAVDLLRRVIAAAESADRLGLHRGRPSDLEPVRARRSSADAAAFGRIDLRAAADRLVELESEIKSSAPGVTTSLGFRAELDSWRVLRSDGTDVRFDIPRCVLSARATGASSGATHGVGASLFDDAPDLLANGAAIERFLRRARAAARLARALPDAPPHPAGSFPLVIDYALAKGLAHEAFGHACEADSFRSSILARDGRFRAGDRVGADHVSIIDEPIENDHAWQPFSANGVPRRRAALVRDGRLAEALSDIWSAEPARVPLTGAARAESFHHAPQPRMTNIRIEVRDPEPAPGAFEEYGPDEVRDLLERAGCFDRHPRFAFLSGYAGGQVNAASGDFAFHCKAIYRLDRSGATLCKPAIFSGSMIGALESVREAFGPLCLDAIGQCGKWGQSVPSSGGSHYFLVLDPHPSVRIGGR